MDIPKVKPVLFTPFNDQYPDRSDSRRLPKQGEPRRQQEREQDRSLNKSQQSREVGINVDLYDKVLFAFLKLSPADPEDAAILAGLGATGFLPARESEFGSLRAIAMALELLG